MYNVRLVIPIYNFINMPRFMRLKLVNEEISPRILVQTSTSVVYGKDHWSVGKKAIAHNEE